MESLLVYPSAKVSISNPSFTSGRTILSGNRHFGPRDLSNSIRMSSGFFPLRCTNSPDNKEISSVAAAIYEYHTDELINAEEVREWESGKSINDIYAKQGITIRRSCRPAPPAGGGMIPRNILEQIIWDKEVEVTQFKQRIPLKEVDRMIEDASPTRDFLAALKDSYLRTGLPALIAEVKKASPSRGILRENFDPVEIAHTYEKNGAACLSILTDEKYFQGSFENLDKVRKAGIKCPLLCKEFIIDLWQIYYARAKGADAVLLIAGVLPDIDIKYMLKTCRELGLTALIEVHNERELDRVLKIKGVQLIGINNRNLENFVVDISNTQKLLENRIEVIQGKDITVVGESGLFAPDDVKFVHDSGVKAVLVGESLIKQEDPGLAIRGLFGKDISK
ncbi:Indole-3-glycerol phosphate synthase-like [Rhynchospora pubera]|uniref:indole-3-glycerol-phosphate synthase n=1 Tax=Rhynchospora pubera TaxID=906938 RepID=A0AAV8FMA0_9POAL|nr:Indole-3-glycerol phosphate synthase-like [Rhynchospora pubera]